MSGHIHTVAVIPSLPSVGRFSVWDIQRRQACGQGDTDFSIIATSTLHNNYTNYNVISTN